MGSGRGAPQSATHFNGNLAALILDAVWLVLSPQNHHVPWLKGDANIGRNE